MVYKTRLDALDLPHLILIGARRTTRGIFLITTMNIHTLHH